MGGVNLGGVGNGFYPFDVRHNRV
jgi:hypothetical protein